MKYVIQDLETKQYFIGLGKLMETSLEYRKNTKLPYEHYYGWIEEAKFYDSREDVLKAIIDCPRELKRGILTIVEILDDI